MTGISIQNGLEQKWINVREFKSSAHMSFNSTLIRPPNKKSLEPTKAVVWLKRPWGPGPSTTTRVQSRDTGAQCYDQLASDLTLMIRRAQVEKMKGIVIWRALVIHHIRCPPTNQKGSAGKRGTVSKTWGRNISSGL